jgi:hypothetical protein
MQPTPRADTQATVARPGGGSFDVYHRVRPWGIRILAIFLGDAILAYIVSAAGLFLAVGLALLLHGAPLFALGAWVAPGWYLCARLGRQAMRVPVLVWRDARAGPRGRDGAPPTA